MSNSTYILVINCGSSSLKYDLFSFPEKKSCMKGIIERIGNKNALLLCIANDTEHKTEHEITDHSEAFRAMLDTLIHPTHGVITSAKDIHAVGHRIVHGGANYSNSIVIDKDVMQAISDCISLAPLHNPAGLTGIETARKIFRDIPQVAVFDTAFHQTMPPHAYLYALPYEMYETYKIRRYGFHGTSHYYVSRKAAEILGKTPEELNLITCHLGNGASIAAIKRGESVDTSMGLTPLEGLMMGTRCGSIDPAIVNFLEHQGMNSDDINTMFNKKSGLVGVSGISNDMRDIENAEHTNPRAKLALQMFAHIASKYVGGYISVLGSIDAIVFTAGIGQYSDAMRKRICDHFTHMGIIIDNEKNSIAKKEAMIISKDDSPSKIMMIPTNEELQIAMDTYALIS